MNFLDSNALGTLAFVSKGNRAQTLRCCFQLYVMLVRPHLEYESLLWSSCYREGAIKLERVQRRCDSGRLRGVQIVTWICRERGDVDHTEAGEISLTTSCSAQILWALVPQVLE